MRNTKFSLEALILCLFILSLALQVGYHTSGHEFIVLHIFPITLAGVFIATDFWTARKSVVQTTRWIILVLIFLAILVVPVLSSVEERRRTSVLNSHDGAVQTEVALKYLQDGKNPYTESYRGTEVEKWNNGVVGFFLEEEPIENPALDYFVYPPAYLAVSYPVFLVSEALFGFYDHRFTLLLFAVLFVWMILRIVQPRDQELAVILFLFNPLLYHTFIFGFNDVVVMGVMFAGVALLQKKHFRWASAFLALAIGVKHLAIFFIPFLGLYIYGRLRKNDRTFLDTLRVFADKTWPFAVVIMLIFVPAWWITGSAFVDALVRYPSGVYPITGFGFSQALRIFGVVEWREYFPFWIVQLAVLIPAAIFFTKRQLRDGRLSQAVLYSTLFFGLAAFFSRFLNINYLAVFFTFLILVYILQRREEDEHI